MSLIDTLCIELTARCPLRCVHCSANAAPQRTEMLPYPVMRARLQEISSLREIYLSGGEPFQHPQFLGILRAARQAAKLVVAYSSGTAIESGGVGPIPTDLLLAAQRGGLGRLDLSLYDTIASQHDAVTTVPGSFEATLRTAHRAKGLGLSLGIHYVPITDSGESVTRVAELAQSLRADRFHILALAPQGRAQTRIASVQPGPHFWLLLTDLLNGCLLRSDESECPTELVVSSKLRHILGLSGATERDAWRAVFMDVRGFLYPAEGMRLPAFKSPSSALDGHSIDSLVYELAHPLQ